MDALTLTHLARAGCEVLSGGWVQRIWQDERGRLTLRIRGIAATHLLMVSADKDAPGFGVIKARPPSPKNPKRLLAYLRAHLEGGRLEQIQTVPFQRVAIFNFSSRSKKLSLVLEAVKRTPILLALDSEGIMRSSDHWEPSDDGRKLVPSQIWSPPPIPAGMETPASAIENIERWLKDYAELPAWLVGLPPEMREWFLGLCEARSAEYAIGELIRIYQEGGKLEVKRGELKLLPGGEQHPLNALEVAGDWLHGGSVEVERQEAEEGGKRRKRWEKKLRRRIANIEADLAGFKEPDKLKRQADALAQLLHTLKRGDGEIALPDPDDPESTILLQLDKRLTPGENLTRLYERVKKTRRAIEVAERRLAEAHLELAAGESPETNYEKRPGAKIKVPYRRFRSSDGWLILAGRNSKENDRLLKEAKGWDLWLHARDGAGAHVLLKKPGRDGRVPERTLIEAAGVAAQNSKLSNESYVEVMVVEAQRVRKVKGGGPGRVHVSGERTVRVAPGAGKPKAIG